MFIFEPLLGNEVFRDLMEVIERFISLILVGSKLFGANSFDFPDRSKKLGPGEVIPKFTNVKNSEYMVTRWWHLFLTSTWIKKFSVVTHFTLNLQRLMKILIWLIHCQKNWTLSFYGPEYSAKVADETSHIRQALLTQPRNLGNF